jgi:uncharacterized protein
MSSAELTIVTTGLVLAGFIKGATGLGFASCALPFLVIAIGLKAAMALVVIPAMATNIGVVVTAGHARETLKRFKWLYLSMIAGVPVGVRILDLIDQGIAVRFLGSILIVYTVLALSRPDFRLSPILAHYMQTPTGFLNGIVTGMTGAQVMPLFPYVMALRLDAARTVQAVNIAVLVGSSLLGVGLAVSGIMTKELFGISLLAAGPALVGVALGNAVRQHLNEVKFRRVAIGTLFIIGFTMLVR